MKTSWLNSLDEEFFRHVRLHYSDRKKTETETNQILFETYGEHASSQRIEVLVTDTVRNNNFFHHLFLHYFHLKRTAMATHNLLYDTYGAKAPVYETCRKWFYRFKIDFNLDDKRKEVKNTKVFTDDELEALLRVNPCQSLAQLGKALNASRTTIYRRLKRLGKKKVGVKWVEVSTALTKRNGNVILLWSYMFPYYHLSQLCE